MKAPSFPRPAILGALILASLSLAAGATAQVAAPALGTATGTVAETAAQSALGNPAAVYCRDMGYDYHIEDADGQRGFCTLPDGQACDAWEFLQGKCGQSYSYCAQQGYEITTLSDGKDPFSPEYAVCITNEGMAVGPVTELFHLSEKATGCGGETPAGEISPLFEESDGYVPPIGADPPTSFDWRSYLGSDWLSPVKNQGNCGSCWSFSAVGVTESAHNIASNNPDLDLNLSEQYMVADCSSAGTCCGGYKHRALAYIRDSGIPDEACMPYVDGTGCSCLDGTCDSNCTYNTGNDPEDSCSDRTCSNRCGDWSSRLTQITSTGYVGTNPQTIKQALVDTGPLAVSMGWGSAFGGYWDGDVYRCTLDTGTNHAVIAVGYNDAGGYWIIKNSWGTGWGDGGYFKIGYGECYIEQYVYYADASILDVGPVAYDSYTVDDDTSDQSNGNGDGIVDCGETIELYVDLFNQGTDTATGVSANISTSDPYVTWPHNTDSGYPDIPGGGTGTNSNDFDFEVAPGAPDGHIIQFDLNITASNGGPWTDSFDVPVTCSANSPPYTPSSPSPADGASGVPVTADLGWTGGDPDAGDTVTYDVYFGTSNPPTPLLCNDTASAACDPGTLSYNTPYYWYVVATDDHGASTSGPVWDFTTTMGGDAYEPDDTWNLANSIYDGSPQTHSIVPADDIDWVMFTLGTESEVVLETSGASGDTRMWLHDSSLTQLEFNDDDGTDLFSRIDRVCDVDALPAGTYYVQIDEYQNNDEIPGYDISFTLVQACVPDAGPLEYDSYVIDDDTTGESDGNDNGIVDCGESIELLVDLINQGSDTATGVDATISTSDPYVTWLYNTSSGYPDIPGSGTGTNSDDFDFEVNPDTPDGHVIPFDLDITASNGGPWTDSFDVPVSCVTNNPPYTPSNPSPEDGATGVSITAGLAWTGGDPNAGDTVTYDVYFGTANPPTTLPCNGIIDTTCDPGTLSYSIPYYWYVVATDNGGASTSGPVWDFTTTAGSSVGPLAYDSHLIDDDTYNESFGNGDGIVDCGEKIELDVDLINQGTGAATLIDATISTTDPYVTWLYNTDSEYPDIPGGGTATNINDFDFEVDPDTPNGHIIQFDLEITAYNEGPWTDSFDVPVSCNNPPNTPSNPTPADGAISVPVTAVLSWTGGDPDPGDTVTYDVYLGAANPPTTLRCDDRDSPSCDPGTLPFNTLNYWYVVATDSHGASTSGPVWSFVTTAGSDAYEPDDTWDQASSIWDVTPQTHSIAPVGDVDWVKFSLSTESEVVLETSGPSGDTRMWLYDSGLTELEYDDDDGTGTFSRIDRLCGEDALPTGTYYVKIDEFGNNAEIPNYDISFTVIQTCDDVGPLHYDSHLIDDDSIGESNGNGDGIVDCGETIELNITLANQGTDAATGVVASISTTDPYVTITDSHEDYPDIAGGGTGEDLEDFGFVVDPATPDEHGTHFVLNITAANGGSWSNVFEVSVECSGVCNDPGEPNDEPGQAVPISYGTTLAGRDICPDGDVDYYSFTGEAGDTIVADIDTPPVASDLDSVLYLYDTDGFTELAYNDDFGGRDSLIAYMLPSAGTYYLMVQEYSHGSEGGSAYTYQISLERLDQAVYLPMILRNQN